ncbi:hypothetical protein NLJ89_g8738 [Agrocybe chaxingu]|uniref:SAM domain-containing protein n=1 Tax=Agrocybe chaxingu TaxID=84603 RepID=A0A9W8MRW2_9AGAR|nr:hypothetical protein NLJ89_g8738 [Agrocybe chaxingu]
MSTIESTTLFVSAADVNVAPASGQANGALPAPAAPSADEGFTRFLKDFRKYESVLEAMNKATKDVKFNDELATIEKWFTVLTEPERNASIHSLLQHSTQDQLRFFVSLIQSMITPEEPKAAPVSAQDRPKLGKLSFRPPSLNLPDNLESPVTPTPVTARESAVDEESHFSLLAQAALNRSEATNDGSTTPSAKDTKVGGSTNALPGFSGINPYTLNMLANAGLSNEAQLLAAQLVMSGLVQPTNLLAQGSAKAKKPAPGNWRTPTSARYPASALRSSGLRPSSGLKSAGLKSSGLVPNTPLSAMDSPREEDFDPEMLKDIPGWLRTLRLHKYTQCFDGLTWEQIVVLDDATLEAKGVAALGARRRLLRTFEHRPAEVEIVDQFTIFTPTWETKTPQSASPSVTVPSTEIAAASQ